MKIGFVCGAFDLLHAGHIGMLKQCKEYCDYLIVGLHVDPHVQRAYKHKPVESILEREIRLWGCKYVDKVIVYQFEDELPVLFKYFNINIRFLGSDYIKRQDEITHKEKVSIQYTEFLPPTSSELRERIKKAK